MASMNITARATSNAGSRPLDAGTASRWPHCSGRLAARIVGRMRVLLAVLARFHADQPEGFDATITAGEDIAQIWDTTLRALRERWLDAVVLGTEAETAASMHAKLARVGRKGGKQPLLAAATVALLCEVGELAADEHNGTCLCWVDAVTC
jgi:hypothetical protein